MANESFSFEEAIGLTPKPQPSGAADPGGFSFEEALGKPAQASPGFIPTIKRTGGQMLTTAATAAEDVVGPNAVTRAVHEAGQGIIDRNPAGIRSLRDLVDSPWLAVKESVGQFAPQIAAAAAGGAVGARAGAALGSVAGPAGAATGGAIGGVAGSLLPIFTQEYGGIRQEQKESGQEDKARALAAAIPATALERVGMGKALNVLKGVPGGAAGTILKEAGKGVLKESATEGAQNVIEQWGAFKDPTKAENLEDTALSAAMGGIGGGVMGAGAGAVDGMRHRAQERADLQASQAAADAQARAEQADPTINWTTEAGATDPSAPTAERTVPPGAPDLQTSAGAMPPREDGLDFTRDVDTSGLGLEDPAEVERARAATMDYEPGDTTPQWDTARGAAQDRQPGLDLQGAEFDTGDLELQDDSRTPSQRMGIDPAAGPLSRNVATAIDSAAVQEAQFLGATGRNLQVRRTGPGVTDESNVIDVQGRVVEDRAIGMPRRLTAETVAAAQPPASADMSQPINRTGEPLQLNMAHALRAQAVQAGMLAAVVRHASGRGYDVVPRLPAPAVVAAPGGAPFSTPTAAQAELQRQQLGSTHELAPAGGDSSLGFVLQKKEQNQTPVLDIQAQTAINSVAERAANWRSNALQANRVAREQGIDPRGKRLAQVVAEIDAADAQRAGVRQDGADLAAGQIDREWSAFASDTGTLGVPRAEMPQIKAEHRGALVNFLKARGIDSRADEVPANDLKPTQAEFSPAKVKKARAFQGGDRSILVSSDGYVLDGHHQWLAKRANGEPVKVIRLQAPIREVLAQTAEFPSTASARGAQLKQGGTDAATSRDLRLADERAPGAAAPASDRAGPTAGSAAPAVGAGQRDGGDTAQPAPAVRAAVPDAGGSGQRAADVAPAAPSQRANSRSASEKQRDDYRAAEAKRTAPGARARSAAADANPFKAFIAKHGIALDQRREFAPGTAEQRQAMVPGYGPIFRRTGKPLDLLAQSAVDEGFLVSPDAAALHDLIGRALRGERIVAQYTADAAETEMQSRIARKREMEEDAATAVAALSDPSLFDLNDDDVVLTADSNTSTEDAMRSLGFTEQEIQDVIAQESAGTPEGSARSGGADETDAGPAQGSAGQGTQEAQPQRVARQDLLGDAPNESQQAAARERARLQQQDGAQRNAAPGPEDFTLGMVDANTGREVAPGQGSIFGAQQQNPTTSSGAASTTASSRVFAPELVAAGADVSSALGVSIPSEWDGQQQDRAARPAPRQESAGNQVPALDQQAQVATKSGAESAATGTRPARAAAPRSTTRIDDFGEKIGGARKDQDAGGGGRTTRPRNADERPAWARRFEVSQIVKSSAPGETGRWTVRDTRSTDSLGQPRRVGERSYATQQDAEQAIPLIAVGQKHRVVGLRHGEGTGWEIWRDVTDRKRVKVVDKVFQTREAALEYMASHAQQIIETNTTFGEADLPRPDSEVRVGEARRAGNARDSDFTRVFGFRGVEFGNWNNQEERQQLLNDAYDGLLDLAEVMGIPPRAVSLNGELALAFGARGHGLSGARAHYEPGKAVINLTKMNGAGSLAHEWFHAMDHYFARQDGKASAQWAVDKDGTRSLQVSSDSGDNMVSSGTRGERSGMRAELRDAFAELMRTMSRKAEQYLEDTAKADQFVASARADVQQRLDGIRADLARQLDDRYAKRNNKPATAEQLAAFDAVAEKIVAGELLDLRVETKGGARLATSGIRWTNDALNQLSAIMKAVRGRQGFNADQDGPLDRLRSTMQHYSARLKMLADAQASSEKTRMVPTRFAMDAKELDQGRGKDYWTTPHEMAARAFQGYVEDKIAAQGGKSPFLNHGPESAAIATPWGWKRPFPVGQERRAINAALDKLVGTIRAKEDGESVALYNTSNEAPPARGLSLEEAQQAVQQALAGLRNPPPIDIVVRSGEAWVGAPEGVMGAAIPEEGRIVLVASAHGSADAVIETVFHEMFHLGVHNVLPTPDYVQVMLDLAKRDSRVQRYAIEWKEKAPDAPYQLRVLRERGYTGSELNARYEALAIEEGLAVVAEELRAQKQGGTRLGLRVRTLANWLASVAERMGMQGLAERIRKMTYNEAERFVLRAIEHAGRVPVRTADDQVDAPRYRTATSVESSMGQMGAAQERVWKKVAGVARVPTLQERAKALSQNFGVRAKQALVDQFAPIQDVSQEAYMLARMSKGSDGTMEAAMLYGRPYLRDGVPDVDVKEGGFAKVLAGLKGEQDRFLWWVAAQRSERLKSEGRENLMDVDDIGVLKTLNAGTMADGTQRAPLYAKAAAQLAAFNESVLKMSLESGLIDKVAYDIMKEQPYVPFYRLMADGDMQGARFSSGLTNQNFAKKLKGGTEKLNADLLENLLLNWSHLYAATARNRAALSTMDAAEKMGVAYTVREPMKGSVRVMRDGEAQHWMVEDPYLLEAVSALHYTASPLMKPLAKMKQLLTWGVTVNPTFKIRNLIRDSVSAIAQSELGYNPAANVKRGWELTASDSQVYASMLASGGVIKFGTQENSDRAREQVKKLGGVVLDQKGWQKLSGQLSTVWNAYSELGDRAENVNRVALYDRLIAQGKSHAEASFMARDLMDFSMSGNHAVVRFLTQSVPFLNARLQGLYKLGRAAHDNPRRFAAVAGAVSLASLALLALYGDDDDWKKREDWDRDSYWWFKIGETAYRIPKPFEVGAIGTLAERTSELMFSEEMTNRRFMERLGHMLAQTFAFDPMPQAFKPLVDIYSNQDSFTGRAIESMADQRLRPQDRYDERTSEVARLLGSWGLPDPVRFLKGEWSELSPKQVEHLLRGYFSWAGATAASVADTIARPALDRGERPDMRLKDVFILGNFVENLPTGSSRYVTQMYEQARQVEQAHASYRDAIQRGDLEKAEEIQRDETPKLQNRAAYSNATRQLSALNQRAKVVMASTEMTGAEKREQLDAIEQQRAEVGHRMNALVIAP